MNSQSAEVYVERMCNCQINTLVSVSSKINNKLMIRNYVLVVK